MRILVTGGAGFIGSHITQALLAQGHEVVVVDNLSSGKRERIPAQAQFVEGDVLNLAELPVPTTIDAVYHLAAQIDVRMSVENPMHDVSINVLGTASVLQYALKAGAKKIIFSSSGGAIYGPCELIPTPEHADCRSTSPYGVSKYNAEQYIKLYGRLHSLPYVILRYSNVYGPGQDGSKESGVIAIFSRLAAQGKALTIFGDGSQTRDFVYVGDVVNANLKALAYNGSGTFNIGTGKETSVKQLADTLNALLPNPVPINFAPARMGEEMRSCLATDLAKSELGWQATVSLAEGLRKTMV